jgi:hypothetical protein
MLDFLDEAIEEIQKIKNKFDSEKEYLDQVIAHTENVARTNSDSAHAQLASWLKELKQYRQNTLSQNEVYENIVKLTTTPPPPTPALVELMQKRKL